MSIQLLYGEEKYLLETKLKKMKKEFGELIKGINFILIDESNVSEIISDIETPAFGYEKKLIIARDTGLFKKEKKITKAKDTDTEPKKQNTFVDKLAKYIVDNQNLFSNDVTLIFVEEEPEKNALYKEI